jgi:hypothetical protein
LTLDLAPDYRDQMTSHLIWAMGVLGDLLILVALFARGRFSRFPWFTLLCAFHFLKAVSLISLQLSGHAISDRTAVIIDLTDVLLQCAVLAELAWIALLPMARLRRLLLALLLVTSGVLIVLRFSPPAYHSLREDLVLMHSLIYVLRLEWVIVLVLLLRYLGLSWRSPVAALAFGLGVFSAHQLAADGYFATGRALSDFAFSSFSRIPVYLLVLSWWLIALWFPESPPRGAPHEA